MSSNTKKANSSKEVSTRDYYLGAITSIWFGDAIKDHASCVKKFDLEPHAALCLLIMAIDGVSDAQHIEFRLSKVGGGGFFREETYVLVEYGLHSLHSKGYVRLDAKGKKEFEEHNHKFYGLGTIQWHLTAKAAKAIVAAYCTCKGLPSSHQGEAIKEILAANKEAIAKSRRLSNSEGTENSHQADAPDIEACT